MNPSRLADLASPELYSSSILVLYAFGIFSQREFSNAHWCVSNAELVVDSTNLSIKLREITETLLDLSLLPRMIMLELSLICIVGTTGPYFFVSNMSYDTIWHDSWTKKFFPLFWPDRKCKHHHFLREHNHLSVMF